MDKLTEKLLQGNGIAENLVKTLVTLPTLINTDPRQGPLNAIQLEVETNQKSASAEVSESLIINMDTKQNYTDNVAPGGKTWNFSGYIPGVEALEPTNRYTPMVQFYTDVLWQWFEKGAVLVLKDSNAQIYDQVVIKELKTSDQKEVANKRPFSMTIKEIKTMETSVFDDFENLTDGMLSKIRKSMPEIGSEAGTALQVGATIATGVKLLRSLV